MAEPVRVNALLKQRVDRVIIENEILRAGFAAIPYLVLRNVHLSVGARLAYAILLMYAWQESSCFPGQVRMAKDLGVSERHLRRYLYELRDGDYVSWRKTMPWGTNTYIVHDVRTKLRRKPNRTRASGPSGHRRLIGADTRVRQIDSAIRPRTIDTDITR